MPAGRCIHRSTISNLSRDRYAHTRQRALVYTLPAPSPAADVTTRGASVYFCMCECECATIIWNSAITPPTYPSECDHRAVIIIIICLIIVNRRRRSLSPTDKRSVRPDNAAFDSRAVLNSIVAIVREQGEVVPFVLLCVPGYRIVVLDCFTRRDSTGPPYQVCLHSELTSIVNNRRHFFNRL